ncbi:hypothetical protein BU16DRAFT_567337 [Lophium mytilinum]|uniref:Uncharacterized protein n=1 Tax=Lophium mytilinum TaxID=390894 RepID=A0A6A6QAT1_9PEZI|nr:hypothetical protein BU16DRAFT_567337 [Lophium mytilinum]
MVTKRGKAAEQSKPFKQIIEEANILQEIKDSLNLSVAARAKQSPDWASEETRKKILPDWNSIKEDEDDFGEPLVDTSIANLIINKEYLVPESAGGIKLHESTRKSLTKVQDFHPDGIYSFELLRRHLQSITTLQEQYRWMLKEHGELRRNTATLDDAGGESSESHQSSDSLTASLKQLLERILIACHTMEVWSPENAKGQYEFAQDEATQDVVKNSKYKSVEDAIFQAWATLEESFENNVETAFAGYANVQLVYSPSPAVKADGVLDLGSLVQIMWKHPVRTLDGKELKDVPDLLLTDVQIAKDWSGKAERIARYAPHKLRDDNPTFLFVRLFFTTVEIEQICSAQGVQLENKWLDHCERMLLASLPYGDEDRRLRALRVPLTNCMSTWRSFWYPRRTERPW